MSSASDVSTKLAGPAAMRIPALLLFMGPKTRNRERPGSDINRNHGASPAWVFQCHALLGYTPRNRASLDSKKYIAFDPRSRNFSETVSLLPVRVCAQ
jgi:hypothetical protein